MDQRTVDGDLRREVFEYLRQLQKLEEQSAMVSGISSWVLIAATCYLSLWLLDHAAASSTSTALLIGVSSGLCLFLLRLLVSPRRPRQQGAGTRLTQFVEDDGTAAGLNLLLIGLAPFVPTVASYLLFGWSFAVVYGVLCSFVLFTAYVFGPFLKPLVKKQRFRAISSNSKWADAVGPILTATALLLHALQLYENAVLLSKEQLTFAGHVTALWWVLSQLTRTSNSAATIKRYAHLEEALMLGVQTPNDVLKTLELHAFGPSLEGELKEIQLGIDAADSIYLAALTNFNQTFEEAKKVPPEYKHEISGRMGTALKPVAEASEKLLSEIEKKLDYIDSVLLAKPSPQDATVKDLLLREVASLKKRNAQLRADTISIKEQVGAIL